MQFTLRSKLPMPDRALRLNNNNRTVEVRMQATVRPLIPGLTRIPLVIRAAGTSEMRVRRQP